MNRAHRSHQLTVVLAVALATAFLTFLAVNHFAPLQAYDLRAIVPSAQTLGPGATVRIAGLQVGRVTAVQQIGPDALLHLAIDKGQGPLPADTRVAVLLRTLVGESYVELYPGQSHTTLPSNSVLPLSQANQSVDVDQILSVLKGDTRSRAEQIVQGLGSAVGPRGPQLNQILGSTNQLVQNGAILDELLDVDRTHVARLVDNVGIVMRAIGQQGTGIESLASGLQVSAQSLAARDVALGQTLVQLPSTLEQVRTTSGVLGGVSQRSAPVLNDVATLLGQLRPAILDLRPAAAQGREVVRSLGAAAPLLRTTLGRVQTIAPSAARALPALRGAFCQAAPAMAYLARYSNELGAFFADAGSASNFYDVTGHALRIAAVVDADSFSSFTPAEAQAVNTLLHFGVLGKTAVNGWDPYPAPNTPAPSGPGDGALAFAPSVPYPKIEAQC
jgi:phospholipid/cholesterol/gamma-HCH transport system substrate-binding protein